MAINTTTNSKESDSDNLLAIKAKIGATVMGINISFYGGASNEEVKKASELDTTSSLIVMGGTADLRGQV